MAFNPFASNAGRGGGGGGGFQNQRSESNGGKFTFYRVKLAAEAEQAGLKLDACFGDKRELSATETQALKLAPRGTGIAEKRDENGLISVCYTPAVGASVVNDRLKSGRKFAIAVLSDTTIGEVLDQ
eukprot:gene25022-31428_t